MATQDEDGDDLYYSIEVDWCRCPLLEPIPGELSRAWVIEGTRMPARGIIDNHDSGMDPPEIAEAFEQDPRLVEEIVAFAEEYRAEARGRVLASREFAALLDGAPRCRRSIGAGAGWWSGWPDRRTAPGCSGARRRPRTCSWRTTTAARPCRTSPSTTGGTKA